MKKSKWHLTDNIVFWVNSKPTITLCKERCQHCLTAELLIIRLNGKKEVPKDEA